MSKVLLVEDEPGLQRVVGDRLRAEGYDVAIVGTGVDAIERIESRAFGLVILDVMLPDLSGMEVCVDRSGKPAYRFPSLC